jgi:DtxR family transcriptional regulator, Mn-dependent transcriptional regulator
VLRLALAVGPAWAGRDCCRLPGRGAVARGALAPQKLGLHRLRNTHLWEFPVCLCSRPPASVTIVSGGFAGRMSNRKQNEPGGPLDIGSDLLHWRVQRILARPLIDALRLGLGRDASQMYSVFSLVRACARYNSRNGVIITISKENYIKTIAEAESEGETVIAATLVRWLNVTAPAVAMAVRRLKRDGMIALDAEGRITLTASGREIANRLLNRHHLIERMLTDIFGMEWYKVHEEAEQLEHAVSEEFERLLREKLGNGEECPHGNRVGMDTPADRRLRGWRPLSEIEGSGSIVSVFERDRRLLEYLNGLGIRPGVHVSVVTRNYDDTLTLDLGGRHVQLGRSAAEKIWIS